MRWLPIAVLAVLLVSGAHAFEIILDRNEAGPGGIVSLNITGVVGLPGGYVWLVLFGPSHIYYGNGTGAPEVIRAKPEKDWFNLTYRIPRWMDPEQRTFTLFVNESKKAAAEFTIRDVTLAEGAPRVDIVPGAILPRTVDGIPVPGTVRFLLDADGSELFVQENVTELPLPVRLNLTKTAVPGNHTMTLYVDGAPYAQWAFDVKAVNASMAVDLPLLPDLPRPGWNLTATLTGIPWYSTYAIALDGAILTANTVALPKVYVSFRIPAETAPGLHVLSLLVNGVVADARNITVGVVGALPPEPAPAAPSAGPPAETGSAAPPAQAPPPAPAAQPVAEAARLQAQSLIARARASLPVIAGLIAFLALVVIFIGMRKRRSNADKLLDEAAKQAVLNRIRKQE